MKRSLKAWSALVTVTTLMQPTFSVYAAEFDDWREHRAPQNRWDWRDDGQHQSRRDLLVSMQPNLHAPVKHFAMSSEEDPVLSNEEMTELVRKKIKYVFVLFNENESFDHEYGTFPGVNGIYSDGAKPRPASETPGFTQTYKDVLGNIYTIQPFRIGPMQNANFADSTDHSHSGLAAKLHVVAGQPQMDGFAQDEYARYAGTQANPKSVAGQKEGTQFARLAMAHVDCDTIPLFWQYANRFTIFDNIFATEDTPSSPNAIAMLAGQAGESQWVKHGSVAVSAPYSGAVVSQSGLPPVTLNTTNYSGTGTPASVPLYNDPQPFWGSVYDTATANRQPNGPKEFWGPTNIAPNLGFASLPLSLAGSGIHSIVAKDTNPSVDLADVQNDISAIAASGHKSVGWRWYQNGYGVENNEPAGLTGIANENYVSHHNGAQYFGYIANNPVETANMKGESDFFKNKLSKELPAEGGVIYVRGGYYNIHGEKPVIQNMNYPNPVGLTGAEQTAINYAKSGDDDHPGYSDHQISESMNARIVNAIASDPELWSQSAIVITYDESDGLYDHVPPRILSYGPDGLPISRGIRIPLLLISPYARAGSVSHAEGDHNAVIETINAIFGLKPLSQLPDEKSALAAGNSPAFNQFAAANGPVSFQQQYLGPRDTNSPITDSLLSGFSAKRLLGRSELLPASYAIIPDAIINNYPHYQGKGCSALGITPTDAHLPQALPTGGTPGTGPFNTLPSTLPAYN